MTLVGKIFAMANFVMTIMIMVVAISVYSTHVNWEKKARDLNEELTDLQKENNVLLDKIENIKIKRDYERAARTMALGALETAKQNAIRKEKAAKDALVLKETSLKNATDTILITEKSIGQLTQVIPTMDGIILQTKEDRDKVAKSAIEKAQTIDQLMGDKVALTRRNEQLATRVASLLDTLRKNGIREGDNDDMVLSPKGKITAIQGNYVEVSIGSDDGLKVGHKCDIFRGEKFIGRIEIRRVSPDRSVGLINKEIMQDIPKVNDTVETKS